MVNTATAIDHILALKNSGQLEKFDAMMVGGSIGRDEIDEFSDIDFFALVKENAEDPKICQKIRWITEGMGEVQLFTGPIVLPDFGITFTAVYENLFMVQFALNDRTSLHPNPMNGLKSVFLFDDSGFYTQFLKTNAHIPVNDEEVFIKAVNRLWVRLLGTSKEASRNNLWLASRFLTEAREQLITLKRVNHQVYPPGYNFHKASKNLEPDFVEWSKALKDTLNTYDQESVFKGVQYCGSLTLELLEACTFPGVRNQNILARSRRIYSALMEKIQHLGH